jgi:hypothetical protein
MRKIHFVALAAAGAVFAASPAFAADSPIVGTWATEAKSDFGTFKSTWTVTDNNGTYAIDVKDAPPEGGAPGGDAGGAPPAPPKSTISNVAVAGNTLTFDRELVMGDMTIKLAYKVTADGSALTGMTHSDFGDIPITGTRQ